MTRELKPGDVIRWLSPSQARLRETNLGKVYRIEADGPYTVALRDRDGTCKPERYLLAELERLHQAGRIIFEEGR